MTTVDSCRIRGNLHTHTTFCDGKDTPRAMVEQAIALGWEYLGFSGHVFTPNDPSYCMSPETTETYFDTVYALKTEYADRIQIYAGLEQDASLNAPVHPRAEYVIGSVHYIPCEDGTLLSVDKSPQVTAHGIEYYFKGDAMAMAEAYFDRVAHLAQTTSPNIFGHFDLLTKFDEKHGFFDGTHPRYIKAWTDAMDALIPTGIPFEINTGAISRGWRTTPYPSRQQLEYLAAHHVPVVITTDAHSAAGLDCSVHDALSLARSLGLTILQPEEIFPARHA